MNEITVRTSARRVFVDVTSEIERSIAKAADRDGVWLVFVPHTTAGVTINEGADPSVARDVIATLEEMAPDDRSYEHAEGNAPAHVMASLVGSSIMIAVEAGEPRLGTWQSIFLCEFDGPRTRRLWIAKSGH